jgi:hypothetical protein
MIDQYNKTALVAFFDYNHPSFEQWAENVYEKIRQIGELAGYVKRDKVVRERFNVIDSTAGAIVIDAPPSNTRVLLKDDLRFTFGRAYAGDALTIVNNRRENMGRIYQIEFEILFNEASFATVKMFDEYLKINNTGSINFGSITFSGLTFVIHKLYKIKVVRYNWEVSLYIDNVSIGRQLLNQDIDTEFAVLYGTTNIPSGLNPDFNKDYNKDFLSLNL